MEGPEITKENSEDLKYFCKICKRKFACGRALGGHMRAHGAAEEEDMQRRAKSREPKGTPVLLCEEEEEEEEEEGWNSMYSLRRNPKRSWRFSDRDYSLLEQNPKEIWESSGENCRREGDVFRQNTGENPERNWGIPPGSSESGSESGSGEDSERNPAGFHSPAKGMRSKRFPTRNSDEEDMAYCLVMLASGARKAEEECQRPADSSATSACGDAKPEEEGASEIQKGCGSRSKGELGHVAKKNSAYECKTCRRIFHTYQALGGHRASHRKVKGCFAKITLLHQHGERFCQNLAEFSCSEEIADATCAATRAPKVHECSICRRTFASGQALGGHKRCHFLISDAKQPRRIEPAAVEELLDLNQPAPPEDDYGLRGGDATRPVQPADVEPRAPCHVRPWWMESDAKQGLFL